MSSDQIDYLTAEDLLILAEAVLGQRPIVREPGVLAAAAARPATVIFGEVAYPTLFGRAAALLFSVCQNHTLIDGNKPVAWAAAVTFLALNGEPIPDIDVDAAESFMLSVADGSLTEVSQIEARLRTVYHR